MRQPLCSASISSHKFAESLPVNGLFLSGVHAYCPMNSVLIFCKWHCAIGRDHCPHLENHSIVNILGKWMANLELLEKAVSDELACQVGLKYFPLTCPTYYCGCHILHEKNLLMHYFK
jgi:hypothetical protein